MRRTSKRGRWGQGAAVAAAAAAAAIVQWFYVISVWGSNDKLWGISNRALFHYFPALPLVPADLALIACVEYLRRRCAPEGAGGGYLIARLVLQGCAASILFAAAAAPLWRVLWAP
jgi:hypothetical protein